MQLNLNFTLVSNVMCALMRFQMHVHILTQLPLFKQQTKKICAASEELGGGRLSLKPSVKSLILTKENTPGPWPSLGVQIH